MSLERLERSRHSSSMDAEGGFLPPGSWSGRSMLDLFTTSLSKIFSLSLSAPLRRVLSLPYSLSLCPSPYLSLLCPVPRPLCTRQGKHNVNEHINVTLHPSPKLFRDARSTVLCESLRRLSEIVGRTIAHLPVEQKEIGRRIVWHCSTGFVYGPFEANNQ